MSNDIDLAEAMKLVRLHHSQKIIGLIMPGKGHPSKELIQHVHFVKRVRTGLLSISQLPNPIPGTKIKKPHDW